MSFSEWREVKLGEIYDFTSGLSKNAKEFGFGFPFLSFKVVFNNYFIPDNLEELANTNEREQEKCSVNKGDVFLTRTSETLDELGMSCIALKDYPKATFNGFTKRLRPKTSNIIDSKYAGYYFRSPKFRYSVTSMSSMTTRASLNNDILSRLPIIIPPMKEQLGIANTLYSLDKKIELNNRINKTLEEMAQAIFKSWFVDFEPFQDGKFEDSELGRIPKGWRVGTLGECVDSIDNRGKTPPLSSQRTSYPIIDVKALSGESRIINYNNCTKYVEEHIYDNWFRSGHPKQYDILISTVGSLAEMKLFYGNKGCIAQNVVGLRSKNISALYLYQYLQNIKKDLISYNIGSVQPSIKVTHFIKHKILIPDDKTLKCFENQIKTISNIIFENYNEAQALAAFRDALLPKLMSGDLRVPLDNESQHYFELER